MPTLFNSPEEVDYTKLKFSIFQKESHDVRNFDCGDTDLNEFLCTEEVNKYTEDNYGITTVVYYEGELVAYYTVASGELRNQVFKKSKGFSKYPEIRIDNIPSLIIGRLAVQKEWQKKGIGRILIQRITSYALHQQQHLGLRLLLVQAKRKAFDFYGKCGFDFVFETKRETKRFRQKGTKTMFFDLNQLDYGD